MPEVTRREDWFFVSFILPGARGPERCLEKTESEAESARGTVGGEERGWRGPSVGLESVVRGAPEGDSTAVEEEEAAGRGAEERGAEERGAEEGGAKREGDWGRVGGRGKMTEDIGRKRTLTRSAVV